MTAPFVSPHLVDERLDDYVDGLMEEPARDAARAHLAACADCATRLEALRMLLAHAAAGRRPVEPPAELWPLVAASTLHRRRLRRQLLHAMRAHLAAAAIVLVVLTSTTTAWVMTRTSGFGHAGAAVGASAVASLLREDAALDGALAGRAHDHGPISRASIGELRARLAAVDDALGRAPDDEALYRALAERARLVKAIRPVLGRGPEAPRAPSAPSAPGPE